MRTATLRVSASEWTSLIRVPEGIGRTLQTDGMTLAVTSDGQGGLQVTATADSIPRRVTVQRTEQVTAATAEQTEESVRTQNPRHVSIGWALTAALAALAAVLILRTKLKDKL